MEILPKLYKLDKKKNITEWEISVVERDDGTVHIVRKHGVKNGKIQVEQREVHGKNIGRSNETTAFGQGVKEAQKKWSDKKKKGYTEREKDVHKITVLPMLAKQWEKAKHRIEIPYIIQPKLDGMRALIYLTELGSVQIISRLGNPVHTVPHINEEVKKLRLLHPGLYFDGELYTDKVPFEELVGLLKSETITETKAAKLKHVRFHAFDLFDLKNTKAPFIKRFKTLKKIIKTKKPETLVLVETKKGSVLSSEVLIKVRDQYIKRGFEGVMFRNINSPYQINKRTADLIKYKKTLDAEFEIVGFEEGQGRDIGTPVFWLKTAAGEKFKARPTGTLEERQKMFRTASSLIGKMATVEYQELSKKGVPRFPVLTRIRETME